VKLILAVAAARPSGHPEHRAGEMGNRFDSLDGMRGICAFIVLIYHCDIALNTGHLVNSGWLCVDAFFVLSGFVIAYKYEASLQTHSGLRNFVRGRFLRLAPTLVLGYLFSALCASVAYMKGVGLWREVPPFVLAAAAALGVLLIPLSMVPGRLHPAFADSDYPVDSPLWSLFGEVVANAFYGLVLHAFRTRTLLVIILGSWTVLLWAIFRTGEGWGATHLVPATGRAVSEFLVGVILLRFFKVGRLNWLPSINPVLVFAGWFFVCSLPSGPSMSWFGVFVGTVGVPLALMFLIRTERGTPAAFRWLGRVSYPLYVCHFGIVWLAMSVLPRHVGRHNIFWAVPMICAAIVAAWCIATLTEWRRKNRSVAARYAT